jgi:hypothetical protein
VLAPHEVLARGYTLKAAVASANSYNLHGLSRSAVFKVCVCAVCVLADARGALVALPLLERGF